MLPLSSFMGAATKGASTTIQPETAAHVARVIAAGGSVEDIRFLDSFFRLAKFNPVPFIDDLVVAASPSWGVKATASASDLYSTTGVNFDMSQAVGASQPNLVIGDLNNKTRLLNDGIDDFMKVTFPAGVVNPQTVVLGGFEQESWTAFDRVYDAATVDLMDLLQRDITPDLRPTTNGGAPVDNTDAAVGVPVSWSALYDGINSFSKVDNNAAIMGSLAAVTMDGFTIGAGAGGAGSSNISYGMIVVLNSANDANYVAKMTALYNFSKAAYGTA